MHLIGMFLCNDMGKLKFHLEMYLQEERFQTSLNINMKPANSHANIPMTVMMSD